MFNLTKDNNKNYVDKNYIDNEIMKLNEEFYKVMQTELRHIMFSFLMNEPLDNEYFASTHKPREILETYVKGIIINFIKENVEESIAEKICSEEFIDDVVKKIKNKQL
jgi:hypothetical protein